DPKSYKYPYLLKGLVIDRPNQVWQTDITYIPMFRGFMYMNAIIDVYSRKILNWSISNSMDKQWCIELLRDTIAHHGNPEIHNSDQGSQYTSSEDIEELNEHDIQMSRPKKTLQFLLLILFSNLHLFIIILNKVYKLFNEGFES